MKKIKSTKKTAKPKDTSLLASSHDLPAKEREKIVCLLNPVLAIEKALIAQCLQAHWNVRGPRFISLHELFEELAGLVEPFVDDTAERITALGGLACGTLSLCAAASPLPEPALTSSENDLLAGLRDSFAVAAAYVRAAVDTADDLGDTGTADLLTGLSRELDKGLWFLDSQLA